MKNLKGQLCDYLDKKGLCHCNTTALSFEDSPILDSMGHTRSLQPCPYLSDKEMKCSYRKIDGTEVCIE